MLAAIRKTKDGYEATFERILRHPPEKVWTAVSDGKHIAKWFTRNQLESKKGGRYVVHHEHVGLSSEEEVIRFEPPHVFEHTWGRGEWAGGTMDTVRWEVHRDGAGSRLVLTYRFRSLDNAFGTLAGWHIWLDVLQAVLGGERREGHEPPHGTFAEGKFRQTAPGKGSWQRVGEVMKAYRDQVSELPGMA